MFITQHINSGMPNSIQTFISSEFISVIRVSFKDLLFVFFFFFQNWI